MRSIGSKRWLYAALAVVSVLVLAACGSSKSSNSGASSTSSSSGASSSSASSSSGSSSGLDVAALTAKLAPYTKAPAHIGPTVKITKPIPAGKSVVFINCGAPACLNMQHAFDAAAAYLKWHVTNLVSSATLQGIQNTYAQAIRDNPVAVLSSGWNISQFPEQAAQLNKLGIPIFMVASIDSATNNPHKGMALSMQPPSNIGQATSLLADKAMIDNGPNVEYGTINLTGYPSVALNVAAYSAEIKSKCPTCKIIPFSITAQDLGTNAPTLITNFLRKNPGVKALYAGYAGALVGLPSAVKTAGVAYPKTYAWAPDAEGVDQLQTGQLNAAVAECYNEVGWQFADATARYLTGYPLQQSETFQPWVVWSNDYHNVPKQVNNPACINNYQAQFKALWH